MKAKTTIDERIALEEKSISILQGKANMLVVKLRIIGDRKDKHQAKLDKLKAKKARQQAMDDAIEEIGNGIINNKDQAIGDKLVESGVITEENRKAIESLPDPADITQEVQ